MDEHSNRYRYFFVFHFIFLHDESFPRCFHFLWCHIMREESSIRDDDVHSWRVSSLKITLRQFHFYSVKRDWCQCWSLVQLKNLHFALPELIFWLPYLTFLFATHKTFCPIWRVSLMRRAIKSTSLSLSQISNASVGFKLFFSSLDKDVKPKMNLGPNCFAS